MLQWPRDLNSPCALMPTSSSVTSSVLIRGFVNFKKKTLGKAMSWKLKDVKKVSSRGGLSSTQQPWAWGYQEGGGNVRLL